MKNDTSNVLEFRHASAKEYILRLAQKDLEQRSTVICQMCQERLEQVTTMDCAPKSGHLKLAITCCTIAPTLNTLHHNTAGSEWYGEVLT